MVHCLGAEYKTQNRNVSAHDGSSVHGSGIGFRIYCVLGLAYNQWTDGRVGYGARLRPNLSINSWSRKWRGFESHSVHVRLFYFWLYEVNALDFSIFLFYGIVGRSFEYTTLITALRPG